jgi:peptidoglycan DL-endopeptidase CwlO
MVGATSFEDFVSRVDMLSLISQSDADLVSQVRLDKTQITETKAALENRRAEEIALRRQVDVKRDLVEQSMARQREYVSTLSAQVRSLIKAEEARQRRLAAERARLALLASRSGSWSGPSPRSAGNLGSPHPDAARQALKYLGVPYVWGGSSPSGFDCSGLCQYAYRKIGINLPRTSRSMYRVGGFIPEGRRDLLEPGDLVFFGYGGNPNRVHHVGMYVGSGNFIHAPGTGDHVKISSLGERISSRGDYVGGVRP